MIQIDGNYLEGGGQIIRTALSLSAVTGKSFEIENVRAGRETPGLKEQHIQSVNAIAGLCNAEHNAKFGSKKFVFSPSKLSGKKEFNIKVRTAGSTALILSTIMPLASKLKHSIKVRIDGGGTWNLFAPSVLYLQKVLLPILEQIGFKAKIKIDRDGFYPKGGAKLEVELIPWKPQRKLNLITHNITKTKIYSMASESLKDKKVAERQANAALKILAVDASVVIKYLKSICPGSGVLITTLPKHISGDAVGGRRKSSAEVAKDAVESLHKEIEAKSGVDYRAADQLMIYMALAGGGGKLKTSRISNHVRTNAYVIEKFLPVKFKFGHKSIECSQK